MNEVIKADNIAHCCMKNDKKSPINPLFRIGEENGKVMQNPHAHPAQHQ